MGGVIGLLLTEMIPERIETFVNNEGNLVAGDSGPRQDEPEEEEFVRGFSSIVIALIRYWIYFANRST